MGCVHGKGTSHHSFNRTVEELKHQNGYHVRGSSSSRGQRIIVGSRQQQVKPELSTTTTTTTTINSAAGDGGEEEIINNKNDNNNNKIRREGEILTEAAGNRGGAGGTGGNISRRFVEKEKIGEEIVDGWPKWLVDNIRRDILAGMIPKSADSYHKLAKIGQGTYSNVYKALDRDTGKIVALKKIRFDTSEPESVRFMAREIIALKQLDHPNVIKLEGLATSRMQYSLYLVFDFMQSDLTRIISGPDGRLTEPQVRSNTILSSSSESDSALGLLAKLLSLDPTHRGTAGLALESEFFKTQPLACPLSGLPAIRISNDVGLRSNNQSRNRHLELKQQSNKIRNGHRRKVSFSDQVNEEFESSKEHEKPTKLGLYSQENMNSSSSTASSVKTHMIWERSPPSPPAAFRTRNDRSAKTEAHPNALKNIQNYPLLLASLTEAANHIQESRSSLNQRSLSTIDYRKLDLEKISKLFVDLNDN